VGDIRAAPRRGPRPASRRIKRERFQKVFQKDIAKRRRTAMPVAIKRRYGRPWSPGATPPTLLAPSASSLPFGNMAPRLVMTGICEGDGRCSLLFARLQETR
jgi:hypothetical protein